MLVRILIRYYKYYTNVILADQAKVIFPLLERFGINTINLGYFVLNNAPNNDTTLDELVKVLKFDRKERRLRCIGHIFNFIVEAYLFG